MRLLGMGPWETWRPGLRFLVLFGETQTCRLAAEISVVVPRLLIRCLCAVDAERKPCHWSMEEKKKKKKKGKRKKTRLLTMSSTDEASFVHSFYDHCPGHARASYLSDCTQGKTLTTCLFLSLLTDAVLLSS
jgi:hypothetical protein